MKPDRQHRRVTELKDDNTPRLQPTDRFSGALSNRVYLSLRDAILRLELQPGQPIRKPQVCELLNVSRAPVSEAVARLVFDGLVEVVPQTGTFVARFSMFEIREGVFLREALEAAAVRSLADTITSDQLRALRRNLRLQQVLAEDKDFDGFHAADAEMHRLILAFTGYPRLVSMSETAFMLVERARRLVLPTPGRARATIAEHKAIIDALEKGDGAAAEKAARLHIRQVMAKLEEVRHKQADAFGSDG